MNEPEPPALLHEPGPAIVRRPGRKLVFATAIAAGAIFLFFGTLLILRATGYIQFYKVPTASMTLAMNNGNNVCVERLTYLFRLPARGDIICFKVAGASPTGQDELYVKRLVGLPGDRLRISGGALFVNGQPAYLINKAGAIHYTNIPSSYLRREDEVFTVPERAYFVLGDNSRNSTDSRMWGAVPAAAVIGRVRFCYWPTTDAGWIH